MPQPISKVVKTPPGGVSILMQPENVAKQPELAALVAQAISTWSFVETVIGDILIGMLGAKALPAIAMYDSLPSAAAQILAVKATAKIELSSEDHKLFEALMQIHSEEAKQRHKFAHWIWAYCEQIPEHLVLVEPSRVIQGHAAVSELQHKQHKGAVALAEMKFTFPWSDEWYCYSKEELQRIVSQFREVHNLFLWFLMLVQQYSPVQLKLQAHNYLNTQPRMLEVLARIRLRHQNDASKPEYNI